MQTTVHRNKTRKHKFVIAMQMAIKIQTATYRPDGICQEQYIDFMFKHTQRVLNLLSK
jgi:hypothetical protein